MHIYGILQSATKDTILGDMMAAAFDSEDYEYNIYGALRPYNDYLDADTEAFVVKKVGSSYLRVYYSDVYAYDPITGDKGINKVTIAYTGAEPSNNYHSNNNCCAVLTANFSASLTVKQVD